MSQGVAALHIAVQKDKRKAVEALLQAGVRADCASDKVRPRYCHPCISIVTGRMGSIDVCAMLARGSCLS